MEVVNGKFYTPKNKYVWKKYPKTGYFWTDAFTLWIHNPWCMFLFLGVIFLLYKILYHKIMQSLPRITKQQLKHYDANNPDGIYLVAMNGLVYNVSTTPRDFGPNGIYKEVTGNDISDYLKGMNFSAWRAGNEMRIWEQRLENVKPVAELWSETGPFWPF